MIEVYVKKQIPRKCATCAYNGLSGCIQFDRRYDWVKFWLLGGLKKCPSYRLDEFRYKPVHRKKRY
jgi:hypothetical protein